MFTVSHILSYLIILLHVTEPIMKLQHFDPVLSIDRMLECTEKIDGPNVLALSFKKINRTDYAFNASAYLPYPMDRKISFRAVLDRWSDGGWKNNQFKYDARNLCPTLNRHVGEMWFDIQRHFNITPGTCPMPAGNYTMTNYVFKLVSGPYLHEWLPSGRFRLHFKCLRNQKLVWCKIFEITLVPKT